LRRTLGLVAASFLVVGACQAQPLPIPAGESRQQATVGGVELEVFTYRPAGCEPRALLLVFHGTDRNARAYRTRAEPLADRMCAVVAAPRFDKARFPKALYQLGGVALQPAGTRTVDLVAPLAEWARQAAGAEKLPLVLLGHSAGAQFLSRVAAFATVDAAGIVIANPSTWVWPSTDRPAPLGFGGVGPAGEAAIRAYLARPVTVLLGEDDTGSKELVTTAQAMAQGSNRLVRGRNVFQAGKQAAEAHGWPFGWTLEEVPGVGHDGAGMLASEQALEAVRRAMGR
jgi:poly(3-hydroxybutyrate) depolymerase